MHMDVPSALARACAMRYIALLGLYILKEYWYSRPILALIVSGPKVCGVVPAYSALVWLGPKVFLPLV